MSIYRPTDVRDLSTISTSPVWMLVILEPGTWTDCLRPNALNEDKRQILLSPFQENTLTHLPLGSGAGSVRNDYPGLLDRVEPPATTLELFQGYGLTKQLQLVSSSEGKCIDPQSPEIAGEFLSESMHGVDPLGSRLLHMLDELPMVSMI